MNSKTPEKKYPIQCVNCGETFFIIKSDEGITEHLRIQLARNESPEELRLAIPTVLVERFYNLDETRQNDIILTLLGLQDQANYLTPDDLKEISRTIYELLFPQDYQIIEGFPND